eukprot:1155438-Pelagomonas_calceolata.AAC.4
MVDLPHLQRLRQVVDADTVGDDIKSIVRVRSSASVQQVQFCQQSPFKGAQCFWPRQGHTHVESVQSCVAGVLIPRGLPIMIDVMPTYEHGNPKLVQRIVPDTTDTHSFPGQRPWGLCSLQGNGSPRKNRYPAVLCLSALILERLGNRTWSEATLHIGWQMRVQGKRGDVSSNASLNQYFMFSKLMSLSFVFIAPARGDGKAWPNGALNEIRLSRQQLRTA